ncbi:MAG: DNA-binding protein [Planctomycetota bacterium]|nr:MAG: DNA-binding protein [Planctomycetota bacterium]
MRSPPRDEAERWLRQAEDDLCFAELGASHGFFAQSCFLAQQAAEKAVKALHYLGGARVVLGHSVGQLLRTLPPELAAPTEVLQAAHLLDEYYVPTRYPNGLPAGTPAEHYQDWQAADALERARRVIAFCRARLEAS